MFSVPCMAATLQQLHAAYGTVTAKTRGPSSYLAIHLRCWFNGSCCYQGCLVRYRCSFCRLKLLQLACDCTQDVDRSSNSYKWHSAAEQGT